MMLHETLTSDSISAGERFISELNKADGQILMAIWKRQDDPDGPSVWRLILVMPDAQAGSGAKCYEKVVSIYNRHPAKFFPLSIFGIEVESLDSDALNPFREAVKTHRIGHLKPDYSSGLAEGLVFSDSFIYIPKGENKGAI